MLIVRLTLSPTRWHAFQSRGLFNHSFYISSTSISEDTEFSIVRDSPVGMGDVLNMAEEIQTLTRCHVWSGWEVWSTNGLYSCM